MLQNKDLTSQKFSISIPSVLHFNSVGIKVFKVCKMFNENLFYSLQAEVNNKCCCLKFEVNNKCCCLTNFLKHFKHIKHTSGNHALLFLLLFLIF